MTPTITVTGDGVRRPTPNGALADLPTLLRRVAGTIDRAGVLLLSGAAATAVGLPATRDELDALADPDTLPALEAARADGWGVGKFGAWTTMYHGNKDQLPRRPDVHLAVGPMLDVDACPLIGPDASATVRAFDLWHELIGTPYHTSPGVAALDVLRATVPMGESRPKMSSRFGPTTGQDPQQRLPAVEEDYYRCDPGCPRACRAHFWAPATGLPYAHGFDLNRAYVGAAVTVDLASEALARTGVIPFDRALAGWWLLDMAPWLDPRLPDPAGYSPMDDGRPCRVRWVTAPTAILLDQLAHEGRHGGFRVLDSYTAPAKRPMRPWGERMRNAYEFFTPGPNKSVRGPQIDARAMDGGDVDRVRTAIKEGGRRMLGILASNKHQNPDIHRPDWWYSIIALSRCNVWRMMDKAARDPQRPMWPIAVDVDKVWYASADPDWRTAAPPTMKIDATGMKLGHYKHGGTRAVRKRRPAGAARPATRVSS